MKPRLTKDDFQAWRGHPVTEAVDCYLRDFAAYIREQWSNGENWGDEAKFQVQNLEDLAALDLESIESFYDIAGPGNSPGPAREEKDEQGKSSGRADTAY